MIAKYWIHFDFGSIVAISELAANTEEEAKKEAEQVPYSLGNFSLYQDNDVILERKTNLINKRGKLYPLGGE